MAGSSSMFAPRRLDQTWFQRLIGQNWFIILLIVSLGLIGVAMQYSVSGGEFEPYARMHLLRLGLLTILMLIIATIDIRIWMALAYPAWIGAIFLLLATDIFGVVNNNSQRWLDLKVMQLQPSELAKISVVLALARYFHGLDHVQSRKIINLIPPVFIIALPMFMVVRQPDFGTGLMIAAAGVVVIFLAGAKRWLFWSGGLTCLAAIPLVWGMMKEYQRDRVLIFLNPELDPLGRGYQSTQSMIGLGSGGMWGKGYMDGTQSHLNFLPEMKTDFIFTVFVEEFGMMGGLGLLGIIVLLFSYGLLVGIGCRSQFGRLLSVGLTFTLFLYIMINVGMVTGMLPVVGVPFPLVSYGGSAMLTWMVAYGLILSVSTHRHVSLAPKGSGLL